MNGQRKGQANQTRVWWDNSEVSFVRWTERSLVFCWSNVTETAIHMPRGAVMRLMQKGVLRVEGEMPEWSYREAAQGDAQPAQAVTDHYEAPSAQKTPAPAATARAPTFKKIDALHLNTQPTDESVMAAEPDAAPAASSVDRVESTPPQAAESVSDSAVSERTRPDRFSIIARLIRKLSGGENDAAEVTS
ncbi:MAG: hypothetical protein JW966_09445 [Anaerolineae bacterium]|nr:hypothetical protein [Anaerolineae bacterium]